ncbi:DUF3089 domain-containing protein [Erythrobacter ani]|uniref:DUF3089 domain-containing protein n=1 Tax=Erythrobacter ani TaxID=2827235 RepID=A0ABS6SI34_9SPHN|nr:DUF3089 domain-containing protein [Erythrobacter ani]MBV7264675.1 DUF3089 domain-containing protein [Erythrobacter ani]
MAKKFLYFIAICIVLFLVGRIGYEIFKDELAAFALVPSNEFTPTEPLEANAYQDPALWYSRPGIGINDPARWQPAYAATAAETREPATDRDKAGSLPNFAVFFIHPTSYLSRSNWNAPIGEIADEEAERIARVYVRGMASPFNGASEIWAPKYRQATMGAFLTDAPEAEQAIDAAYADVLEAYRYFLGSLDDDTPIVLAGHSQGSLHLLRLLREEVTGSPEADRLVAAYAIGWPISVDHDLPALGIAACATPAQTGCLLSWSSFAEPADPSSVIEAYSNSVGFDGELRGDSTILCTNPLTGKFGGSAPESANLGTLVPDDSMSNGELVPGAVPARCDERGLLLIGDPPELGSYVLPGNNYHVYDIPLFWANTQADVAQRAQALEPAN